MRMRIHGCQMMVTETSKTTNFGFGPVPFINMLLY